MIYLLTLFLWTGTEWIKADPIKFPQQEYDTIQECVKDEFFWNRYYSQSASKDIGINRALCIEKNAF